MGMTLDMFCLNVDLTTLAVTRQFVTQSLLDAVHGKGFLFPNLPTSMVPSPSPSESASPSPSAAACDNSASNVYVYHVDGTAVPVTDACQPWNVEDINYPCVPISVGSDVYYLYRPLASPEVANTFTDSPSCLGPAARPSALDFHQTCGRFSYDGAVTVVDTCTVPVQNGCTYTFSTCYSMESGHPSADSYIELLSSDGNNFTDDDGCSPQNGNLGGFPNGASFTHMATQTGDAVVTSRMYCNQSGVCDQGAGYVKVFESCPAQ